MDANACEQFYVENPVFDFSNIIKISKKSSFSQNLREICKLKVKCNMSHSENCLLGLYFELTNTLLYCCNHTYASPKRNGAICFAVKLMYIYTYIC